MLPHPLVRARVRAGKLEPTWLGDGTDATRSVAAALLDVYADAARHGWRRAQVEAEVRDVASASRGRVIAMGLAHILDDATRWESVAPVPPAELRAAAFTAARAESSLALHPTVWGRRTALDVLDAVGASFGLSAAQASAALYADLPAEHVAIETAALDVDELLSAYDVALAQSVLAKSESVTVELTTPSVARVRALLRRARFHQLVWSAARTPTGLQLQLDGPLSILARTTRYGQALARFFPSLLHASGWRAVARVRWRTGIVRFEVDANTGLRPRGPDTGAYKTRVHEALESRWAERQPEGWTMEEATLPLDLGGEEVVMPDYVFTHGNRAAALEIQGTWRPETVVRRLEMLRRHRQDHVVLAVSRKLSAQITGTAEPPPGVLPFGEVIAIPALLTQLDAVARPRQSR